MAEMKITEVDDGESTFKTGSLYGGLNTHEINKVLGFTSNG